MRPSLALLRTTTFRLALVQAGVVLAFVLALLGYIYIATIGQLTRDADVLLDQEYATLERAYAEGGIRRLEQEVGERAARDGPLLYVLAESNGAVLAGDFTTLPAIVRNAPTHIDLNLPQGAGEGGEARGLIGRLIGGPILLVARDLGDSAVISDRIRRVLWTVLVLGVLVSVASGLMGSWLANRRAEDLSNTAREVMAGDLTRRAPVRGVGDEFDTLAEALNAMLDRLEQLMQTTRTAGDAIAHDLRSPLTRFRQKLESALDAPPNTEADRVALRKAVEEADRLLDMFAGVLRLARVEASNNWRFELVAATDILRELAEFYEPAAEEEGLTFESAVEEDLRVMGDVGLFTQAVSNLIENSMKYTPSGGRVEVRAVKRQDGRVEIAISDNGPGVAPGDRERVLERFVRMESARTTQGAGLGLSLVAAVARLHRGGIHLRDGLDNSAGGKGLCAALVLPAAP